MKRKALKDNAVVTLNLNHEKRTSDGKVVSNITNKMNIEETALFYHRYNDVISFKLSAVYAALSLISNSIALLPIYVKQHKDDKDTIIPNHPVERLFYNMLQSKHTLIKQIIWDLLTTGNAYIYIKRKNKETVDKLIYMRPSDVVVRYEQQEDLVTYQCLNHTQVPKEVSAENILHFAKDTYDGVNGRGFLWFAGDVLQLAGYTQQAAMDFFGNGCNLTGILKFTGRVNDAQKQKIREQWRQIHGTAGIGGGLGILEGDADYVPISQDASSSQMLETREYNVVEIARFFNINPVLLGDLSHSSYNSIEDAQIEFTTHTLLPLINLLEEEINRKLIKDVNQYIDFDENFLMKGNKATLSSFYTSLVTNGILTVNEAREALNYNKFDTDEANSLIIPFTDISQNVIGGDAADKNTPDDEQ